MKKARRSGHFFDLRGTATATIAEASTPIGLRTSSEWRVFWRPRQVLTEMGFSL
jgi:hypothetical protein